MKYRGKKVINKEGGIKAGGYEWMKKKEGCMKGMWCEFLNKQEKRETLLNITNPPT